MKTDKHFFKLFQKAPKMAYTLLGEEPPEECKCVSETFKETQQEVDLLLLPGPDDNSEATILEIQFYDDPMIYARIVSKMAQFQMLNDMRAARGVILFRYAHQDPKTKPWSEVIRGVLIRDALNSLVEREPDHVLVGLFQPLLVTNDETLAEMAPRCYNRIVTSDLDAATKDVFVDVFTNWLIQRFKDKTKMEIETMLLGELPDLRETQAGKDLIAIGKAEMIVSVLKARFASLSPALEGRILAIRDEQRLSELVIQAATCQTLNEMTV